MLGTIAYGAPPAVPGGLGFGGGTSAALREEPARRVVAPPAVGGPQPVSGAGPASGLGRVEIVGPRPFGAEPIRGGRPGALVDGAAIGVSQQQSGDASRGAADDPAAQAGPRGSDGEPLSEEEQRLVRELKARDAEVRRHEQAHASVGGPYAGAPTYTYQQGPDGRRYAIGGQVAIDSAPVEGDPEATIRKLEIVRRAALAPAEPSAADRAIAAEASAGIQEARAELAAQRQAELRGEDAAAAGGGLDGTVPGGEAAVSGIGPAIPFGLAPRSDAQPGPQSPRIVSITV